MRKGTPEQLMDELNKKIDELKGSPNSSSRVIVDDEEDVIVAGEDIEDVVDEVVEDTPEAIDVEVVEDDKADYLTGMYASVEKELRDLTESVAWDSDEDSIYLDVNFADGHVFTFTIPKADLAYDLEDPDKDIEYICNAVRDAGGAEALEDEYYDDYSDEEGISDNYDDDEAVYL